MVFMLHPFLHTRHGSDCRIQLNPVIFRTGFEKKIALGKGAFLADSTILQLHAGILRFGLENGEWAMKLDSSNPIEADVLRYGFGKGAMVADTTS